MLDMKMQGRTLLAAISGELDHHAAETLRFEIDRAVMRENAKNIILDFKSVTFMDSSGIGMIIGRYKNVQKQGGRLFVADINANLQRIFELSGLKKIIPLFDTVETALKEVD